MIPTITPPVNVTDLTETYAMGNAAPMALSEWWRLASRAKDRVQWTRPATFLHVPESLAVSANLPEFGTYLISWLIRYGKLQCVTDAGVIIEKIADPGIPAWV